MKSESGYGGRYLYAEDLIAGGEHRAVTVRVSAWHDPGTLKTEDGRAIPQPGVSFEGKSKVLILCKTNISLGVYSTGEQPGKGWVGKEITIAPRVVDAFGERVVAIRIIPPRGTCVRKALIKRMGTPVSKGNNHAE